MKFYTSRDQLKAVDGYPCGFLRHETWNDWYKYETKYHLFVWDRSKVRHSLGAVKIGHNEMVPPGTGEPHTRPPLPEGYFERLDSKFFSLGQDDNYYETLNALPRDLKVIVLQALRDVAFSPDILDNVTNYDVFRDSILRDFASHEIRGRLHLLAHDRAPLTSYHFSYESGGVSSFSPYSLTFKTTPQSTPPSNIHVLIGRNGVGKTHCLRNIALCLSSTPATPATLKDESAHQERLPKFRRVVHVSFSAFDPFIPSDDSEGTDATKKNDERPEYYYIGLKERVDPANTQDGTGAPDDAAYGRVSIDSAKITESFTDAVRMCTIGLRRNRWQSALQVLCSDPVFSECGIREILDDDVGDEHKDEDALADLGAKIFNRLSSGHKLVLLIVSRLVVLATDRTLVLLDEPEAHLHPPLASSLIRCLSQVLFERNGVAIVATHSPVVLQEVPSSCVYRFFRVGRETRAERPATETFGGGIGKLTDEIFGHEVTDSGFYTLLKRVASESSSYEEAVKKFGGQLSGNGKAILRMLPFGASC